MRTIFILLGGMLGISSLLAQTGLQSKHNMLRAGDEIIKQQVEYKDPGRSGENVLWDFSQLQVTNPEYTVSYHAPRVSDGTFILGLDTFSTKKVNPADFITGYEHFTAYHYRLQEDQLFLLGHSNAVSQMRHEKLLLVTPFPFNYGQKVNDTYHSQTLYAGARPMQSEGNVEVEADASGMMVLPSKDTLRNVIRIKTIRTIVEIPDTAIVRKHAERNLPEPEWMNTRIESYLWYEKGYRYPVFETIRNSNGNENENDSAFFSTAFFYPPQEHYYLGDDEDNLALLDSLALEGDSLFIDPWEGLTYNFYPNPVVTNLEIEIYMPKTAEEVRMQLTDRLGRPVWSENYGRWTEGIHTVQVFMMPFMVGEYVLNMWFDEHLIGEKILKR